LHLDKREQGEREYWLGGLGNRWNRGFVVGKYHAKWVAGTSLGSGLTLDTKIKIMSFIG
jgi:hypothetical protein